MRIIKADDFIEKISNWVEFHTIGFNKTYSNQDLAYIRILQSVLDLANNMALDIENLKEWNPEESDESASHKV